MLIPVVVGLPPQVPWLWFWLPTTYSAQITPKLSGLNQHFILSFDFRFQKQGNSFAPQRVNWGYVVFC